MSEFSTTAKKKTDHLSSLLLSDFMLFCSFILSHPLYFSYFIFFSPYLFKIFSFLSPLFVTTTLLLLAFINQTASANCHLQIPESKVNFLLATYQTLVQTLKSKVDYENDGFGCLEELEVYKIVFETLSTADLEISENLLQPEEEASVMMQDDQSKENSSQTQVENKGSEALTKEKSVENARRETNQVMAVVKLFEDFLQEKEGVENLSSKKREKEDVAITKLLNVEPNKVSVVKKEETSISNGSKVIMSGNLKVMEVFENGVQHADYENDNQSKITDNNYKYETMGGSSMRKEKEWRRTLACKLFEERHNVGASAGGEGMDLLWETYDQSDTNNNKVQLKNSSKKGKIKGSGKYDCYYNGEDDEYEEDSEGQLCCLQALKFSAGKMNLGMGKPNLLKISKAFKGFGWLHHVSSRHVKKGYHRT